MCRGRGPEGQGGGGIDGVVGGRFSAFPSYFLPPSPSIIRLLLLFVILGDVCPFTAGSVSVLGLVFVFGLRVLVFLL
jgi:hypothetical protein